MSATTTLFKGTVTPADGTHDFGGLRLWPYLFVVASLAGCVCKGPPTQRPEQLPVRLTVDQVDFGKTYIGYPTTREIEATNPNGFAITFELATTAPFSVEPASLRLEAAESRSLQVNFAPVGEGVVSGKLVAEQTEVGLTGEGVEPPACDSPGPVCSAPLIPIQARAASFRGQMISTARRRHRVF